MNKVDTETRRQRGWEEEGSGDNQVQRPEAGPLQGGQTGRSSSWSNRLLTFMGRHPACGRRASPNTQQLSEYTKPTTLSASKGLPAGR